MLGFIGGIFMSVFPAHYVLAAAAIGIKTIYLVKKFKENIFMRIMTTNIWGDFFNNPVSVREGNMYKVYENYSPDIIGFQEVTDSWYKSNLFKWLSEEYYFVGTELTDNTDRVPLAIKKKYELIAKGYEQLADTPDVSKAITWAVLKDKTLERIFAVCNTHFWWMRGTELMRIKEELGVVDYTFEDHCAVREENAEQLAALMRYLRGRFSCPVFAFGDMNSTITEKVFDVYESNGAKKLFDLAKEKDLACSNHGDPVGDADGLFHGVKASEERIARSRRAYCLPEMPGADGYFTSIDHIIALGDGFEVLQYRVIEDQYALDATDHSPVFADVEFVD